MKVYKNSSILCNSAEDENKSIVDMQQKKSFEEIWAEYTDAEPFTTQVWKGEDFLKFMEEVADNA